MSAGCHAWLSHACELCRGGSDWQKIMIKQINPDGTSTLLNDTLSNVKFSNTAWAPDNKVIHCPEVLSVCHPYACASSGAYSSLRKEDAPLWCHALKKANLVTRLAACVL